MMNTAVFGEGRLPDAPRPRYWAARELVAIGIFAAAAKLTSLLIALAGGGMNPATLLLKNLVFTTLVVVMLYKVRKQWTLLLFTTVNMLISLILLGGSVTLIPTAFAAALLGEGAMRLAGGPKSRFGVFAGVGVSDFAAKVLSLGVSFLFARETPALVWMVVPFVAIGYIGSFAGEASRRRMMQDVPKADVVITNPTHLAVAIKYEPEVHKAPVVLAKGEDYLAQKIREAARENHIEIVENKPLARMLYANVEIGNEIPPELYQAVAEILAMVYNMRQ